MSQPKRRIEAYLGRLFGYGLSLAGDREQARDLVQDCALKALSATRVPADEAAYRAWLFRILRNTYLDHQKRVSEVSLSPEDLDSPYLNGEVWNMDERMISVLTVRLGMTKLTSSHREVIALVDIGGFSYAEAADFLSVPPGTVMSRLCRARQALLLAIDDNKVRALPTQSRRAVK